MNLQAAHGGQQIAVNCANFQPRIFMKAEGLDGGDLAFMNIRPGVESLESPPLRIDLIC